MRCSDFIFAIFALTLLVSSAMPVLHAGEADGEQILRDLQGDDFDLRRAAQTKLETMGETARAILEKAAASGNPEVQATATALLKKLENSILALAVYDRDGKPVAAADADVKLYFQQRGGRSDWSEPRSESIQTQANGRVEMSGLAPGPVNVQFEWKKAVRDGTSWWNLELQRGVNPLVVTLTKGGELKLSVKNDKDEPLKDATVTLYNNRALENELLEVQLSLIDQWDRSGISATTDKDGVAHVESAAEGTYQTVVRADGFLPTLGPVVTLRNARLLEAQAGVKLQPRQAGKLQMQLVKRVTEEKAAVKVEKKEEKKEEKPKEEVAKAEPKKDEKPNEAKADAADATWLKKQRVIYDLEYIFEGPRAAELQQKQKQLRQTLNAYRNAESPETDEQGKLTLEDLKPGRYRLTVGSGNEAPWRVDELVIKPGEMTDLGALQNVLSGTVKGKILDAEGKGVQYMNITLTPETNEDESEVAMRIQFGMRNQLGGARSVQTQKDGTYEIKNMPAGRYVATTQTRRNQPIRIEGIVVEAGKTVEAAEVRLPADGAATGKGFIVKGIVKLPDGKPAAQATVNLHSTTFGRWSRNADDKGAFEFSFSPEQGWTPTAISVKAANCKAAKVDLTGPNTKLDAVEVLLEKQDYGALRVKVTDENGAPLEGVSLRPRQSRQRYNAFNQVIDRRVTTNKAGEARLGGLATGQRSFLLDLEGYYMPDPLNANILADGEAEASVRMKRGVSIRGRVEVAEGLANTIAVLQGTTTRTDALDENGNFEFTGLTPGDYFVSAAGPGLTTVDKIKVSVTPKGAPDTVVKAVRSGGAIVTLPADAGFGTAVLTRRDKTDEGQPVSWKTFGNGFLDSNGRAEFWGAAPGDYEVLLSPATPVSVIAPYRTNNVRTVKTATASLFAGAVKVQPLKTHEDLRTLEPVKIATPTATASVRGNLTIEVAKGVQQNAGNLTVRLVGEKATASVNFTYPTEFAPNALKDPLIFGEKKERKSTATVPPGSFKFTNLPAGEYKLYVDVMVYRQTTQNPAEARDKKQPVPVQMVVVKDGEAVDLSAIPYTPNAEAVEAMRQSIDPNFDTEPEDQIPLFQP